MTRALAYDFSPQLKSAAEHAAEVRELGFTVLTELCSLEEVEKLRSVVEKRMQEVNPPCMWSPEERYVPVDGNSTGVHHVGFGFFRFLEEHPELAPLVFKPRFREVLQAVLGEGFEPEMQAAVVTDSSRPFLRWHSHVGGNESGHDPEKDGWPEVKTVERTTNLLYLDDIDDDSGVMLLYPRRLGSSTAPPHDDLYSEWPGQIEVRVPRGTLVIMDQCTWHAARPKQTPGLRVFLPGYVRAAGVPGPRGTRAIPSMDLGGDAGRDNEASTDQALESTEDISEKFVAELSQAVSSGGSWSLNSLAGDSRLLSLDLAGDGFDVTVEIRPADPGTRSFVVLDGLAYSYLGKIEREQATVLRELLQRIHPVAQRQMTG